MVTAAVIGRDGRASAVCTKLEQSGMKVVPLGAWKGQGDAARAEIVAAVKAHKADFVFVGPEDPLAAGIVDALGEHGIPAVGPAQALARLESSKAFARQLLAKFDIPGNPRHRIFHAASGIEPFLRELGEYVIKPDGLTGGKGVKVSGDHLQTIAEALDYCGELFGEGHRAVIVEERLDGEEFSLQSFCDGTTLVHMPVVQDHKRAFENDAGPNTGGMGSYSCADHRLPFLSADHVRQAAAINEAVVKAIRAETGAAYKGILYGGFMLTRDGVRLIEYNVRFGDPEALNILSILATDFGEICKALIAERLHHVQVKFQPLATVCKYVVPAGYPSKPERGAKVDLRRVPPESDRLKIYRAAVEERDGELYMTGSRAIGFVGIDADLSRAAEIAEEAAALVAGPVRHRRDIGTAALIARRVRHVESFLRDEPGREVRA